MKDQEVELTNRPSPSSVAGGSIVWPAEEACGTTMLETLDAGALKRHSSDTVSKVLLKLVEDAEFRNFRALKTSPVPASPWSSLNRVLFCLGAFEEPEDEGSENVELVCSLHRDRLEWAPVGGQGLQLSSSGMSVGRVAVPADRDGKISSLVFSEPLNSNFCGAITVRLESFTPCRSFVLVGLAGPGLSSEDCPMESADTSFLATAGSFSKHFGRTHFDFPRLEAGDAVRLQLDLPRMTLSYSVGAQRTAELGIPAGITRLRVFTAFVSYRATSFGEPASVHLLAHK